MLQLKDVKKDYKVADSVVSALKGVSLEFRANEFVSILGPSGCGKTTLLNIIGGLDQYTSGDLVIRGVSTKDYKDRDWDVYRNHRIGFVFQSYNLIPHQSVLGNVELALTIAGCSKEERRKRATDALKRVGLGAELNKRPNQLSGGQMQRVAIARALVNNPEILLADEPTGALDSKTSVQIMDLIREIAGERLVIMVTHNPELAEQYSSRIVRLQDGLVVSDSNPYDSAAERKELEKKLLEKGIDKQKMREWKRRKKEREAIEGGGKEKAAMSFGTALGLSARNLRAKKGRTAVTSIAGSIGIISVCLVLALSNGFNNYILGMEEDMLSYYPVEVKETSMDVNSIMQSISNREEMPKLSELDNKVYVNSFLTKLAKGMTVTNNISEEYISYIEDMNEDWYHAIQYDYGVNITDNIYTEVGTIVGANPETGELITSEQVMSLSSLKTYYTQLLTSEEGGEQYASLAPMVSILGSVVNVMPGTEKIGSSRYGEYVELQYDNIWGDLPKASNEAVLVVGENNDLTDILLAQLGYLDSAEFLALFADGEKSDKLLDFETQVVNKGFTLFYNDAIYSDAPSGSPFVYNYEGMRLGKPLAAQEGEGVNIKISGIYRLKKGLTYGCLSDGLNLTEQLINELIAVNMQSKIVQKAQELRSSGATYAPLAANFAATNYSMYSQAIRALGGNDSPTSISFFSKDFGTKDKLVNYLDKWNKTHEEGDQVTYTDAVELMMGMIQAMLDAVTYVLVSFTAISLVVSSVMIGIITYVSVVERTKEIGVLRSLGARKGDIRNLFNAETFIIGLAAGLFGVVISYLLCLLVNAILTPLTGIPNLADLKFTSALIMVLISVILTLISGLIPASKAAKKDPVLALRTE